MKKYKIFVIAFSTNAFTILTITAFFIYPKKILKKTDGVITEQIEWPFVNQAPIGIEYKRIKYYSDNLEITGLIAKQHSIKDKAPVVIYNRGGNREFGKIVYPNPIIYRLACAGYVVMASQYRGNDDSQGKEQFGGDDVNDVVNLIKTIKYLPYADENRVFMVGHSRGGMMTYIALRKQTPVKAAVVIGALTDLFYQAKQDPLWEIKVLHELIPHLPEHKEREYKNRSAVFWADDINVPLLIQHCADDEKVNIAQAESMAEQMKKNNKQYTYLCYAGNHRPTDKMIDDMIEWLNKLR